MNITNNAELFINVHGRLIRVCEISRSIEDANSLCKFNPTWSVIAEAPQDRLIFSGSILLIPSKFIV